MSEADDPKIVTQKAKLDAERERAKKDFVCVALGTREGRIFFWDLLGRCGVFRNPWTANALVTAFNAGEMNIGQEVLATITSNVPDFFATMIKENQDG